MLNDLPKSGIRPEGEVEARNGLDETSTNVEDAGRRLGLLRKEHDIWQQPLEGQLRRERLDRVPAPFVQSVDPDQGGREIFPSTSQITPEGRPIAARAP